MPERRIPSRMSHPTVELMLLIGRNILVGVSATLFIITFFMHGEDNIIKAIGYFTGAGAYLFECLTLTDCFRKKADHKEMFMVYCLGPLYILMGIDYILWH